MSTLKDKAQEILDEKIAKIKPENIKKDIQIFDITGILDEELPTLDIIVPNSIDIDLSADTHTLILENTPYIPDVIALPTLLSREKNSQDNWQLNVLGSMETISYGHNINNKLGFDFGMWFWEEIDDYEFKIELRFVKDNYVVQVSSVNCNMIKPNNCKLQLSITANSGSSISGVFTNPNDIIITDTNDVVISGLTKTYLDNYWTDTFDIKTLPIGNYKLKLNYNNVEVYHVEFSITEDDMSLNQKFTKRMTVDVWGIYMINGEVMFNDPRRDDSSYPAYFAKCRLTRQDSEDQPVSKEIQISPNFEKTFVCDGAEKLELEISKPGYSTQLLTYDNGELVDMLRQYIIVQDYDMETHNSVDIVIGPWEDEQAGTTSAAPDDLDISIYLQNDNGEYVLVDDESIGYYVSNFNENKSAVVVFGKMNQNVKLVLNDSRYKFSQQEESEHEAIRSINEWGYTIGLYPVEQE